MSRRPWIFVIIVVIALAALAILPVIEKRAGHDGVVALSTPAASGEMPDHIKDEAGIAAYYKIKDGVTLDELRGLFNTIELDPPEYLLGSMSVPGYPEIYDPHVYIGKDGWVLAYYFTDDPVAKIIDVKAQDLETTTLGIIVATIVQAAGVEYTGAQYYDFRYPNATQIMFVAENYNGGENKFTVHLPSSYTFYEYSWALAGEGNKRYFRVNGTNQAISSDTSYWDESTGYGTIAEKGLAPGKDHSITVDDYGVLVLLYREPD